MSVLTEKQQVQEASYSFPYHYLDLEVDAYKYILFIEYLSYLNIVKKLIEPFNGQFVLDVGCGDGRFCYQMQNENVKMVGTDCSERAIRFAKAFNPDSEFFVQDLTNLTLPYVFDYVVLIETLEHFIPEEVPIILKNISSVLKENGKLIITVPSPSMPLGTKHYQHFTVQLLQETLKPYFKIVKVFGHNKKDSIRQKLFYAYIVIAYLMIPFRNKIKFVRRFYDYMRNYYIRSLESCDADQGYRLIAVCRKEQ